MQNGYSGKLLWVDLSQKRTWTEDLDEQLVRQFIGGVGLGVRILLSEQKPGVDPFGPENIIGFMPGLFGGTDVPSASRLTVVSKSPLTGGWGDASVGGFAAYNIRRAGYDGVMVKGIAEQPLYLLIDNDRVELRDAGNLWGLDTFETTDQIHREVGSDKFETLCIGPAGEKKSLIAAIIAEKERAAGRSGMAAVMGAKKLKAVAIRGSKKVPVADEARFKVLRKDFLKALQDPAKMFIQGLKKGGTAANTEALIAMGAGPIKNWSLLGAESLPENSPKYGAWINGMKVGTHTCSKCPVACKGVIEFRGDKHPRPEYETIVGFGALSLNLDVDSVVEANLICNQYGIDTISASGTVAFAIDCFENSVIDITQTKGLKLLWGETEAILELLRQIGKREGFGDIVADGVKMASHRLGPASEAYAVHVHGQELAYHDPRLFPARGTAYFCDPTPGRHTTFIAGVMTELKQSLGPDPQFKMEEVEVRDFGSKRKPYGFASRFEQVTASTGMCKFVMMSGALPLIDFINALTGWDFSLDEMLLTGERIQSARQLFNIREGIQPVDFRLPERVSKPAETGPFKHVSIDFSELRKQYYDAMNWDVETGYPKRDRMRELGMTSLLANVY